MSNITNTVQQIFNWFVTAVPKPVQKNLDTQLGVHFEEVAEMLQVLMNSPLGTNEQIVVGKAHFAVSNLATMLKSGELTIPQQFDDVAMLDAIADQVVTAIGVGHMYSYDVPGGINEVAESNDSKFENGEPVFNQDLKIMKGCNYFKANLANFV